MISRSTCVHVEIAELLGIDVRTFTFSYAELKTATEEFSPANKLGEGGFGPVFKVSGWTYVSGQQFSWLSDITLELLYIYCNFQEVMKHSLQHHLFTISFLLFIVPYISCLSFLWNCMHSLPWYLVLVIGKMLEIAIVVEVRWCENI